MTRRLGWCAVLTVALLACPLLLQGRAPQRDKAADGKTAFHTSDRCVACHNGLKTSSGEDISIGFQWRASIMANSARDPYWQGSVRRESIDHPESSAAIQDECSTCHMPITHLTAHAEGKQAEVLARLPLSSSHEGNVAAADGVSCSVCHQIENIGLGTKETFNGNVKIASLQPHVDRSEYGPFEVDPGHQRIMRSSTAGFQPVAGAQMRDAALCGTCHTLYTKALGPGGQQIGTLPEQMPYIEWQHSDYKTQRTCQSCHMPEVHEPVAVTALYGQPREGMHRHEFVGGNFLMENMLNQHRDELDVKALPEELNAAAARAADFLRTQTARISVTTMRVQADRIAFDVHVENLTGHKFPTAYPSRRAWLHVTVLDAAGNPVFESGALNADGSIVGNDNDADPARYEPHYREITEPSQVEIFEPILGDAKGHVTTGLLSAVGYLKDNRLLPAGFDKHSASHDIAVEGAAADDPQFTDKGSVTRYVVRTTNAGGPYRIVAELWYQPVGFRWAHNLEPYKAAEPQRFVSFYEGEARRNALMIVKTEAVSAASAQSGPAAPARTGMGR
jgi:hypothetical protein